VIYFEFTAWLSCDCRQCSNGIITEEKIPFCELKKDAIFVAQQLGWTVSRRGKCYAPGHVRQLRDKVIEDES